jgi:hypothetical protein
MKFEINTLLATRYNLKLEINKENVKFYQKEKNLTLYDENEMFLLKYLNSNKYI